MSELGQFALGNDPMPVLALAGRADLADHLIRYEIITNALRLIGAGQALLAGGADYTKHAVSGFSQPAREIPPYPPAGGRDC